MLEARSSWCEARDLWWLARSERAASRRECAAWTALLSVVEVREVEEEVSARMPESIRVVRRVRRLVSSQVRRESGR